MYVRQVYFRSMEDKGQSNKLKADRGTQFEKKEICLICLKAKDLRHEEEMEC